MPAGRSTFTKRQKEQSSQQKRQEKEERKKQRALEKKSPGPEIDWSSAVNVPISSENDESPEHPV